MEIFTGYFDKALSGVLPELIRESIQHNPLFVGQEFVPISEACSRYKLSRRSLYNYHYRKCITLRSTEGKTFVSILELEKHIRNHPVVRKQR